MEVVEYLVNDVNVSLAKVDIYNRTAKDVADMFGRSSLKKIIEAAEERHLSEDVSTLDLTPTIDERDSQSSSPAVLD